jgi:predicted metal-dependent phosphoesterase TrpH
MIDLHTHTTASDGTDSPAALVNKALSAGIKTLAITDHDSTSGWSEAITALRPSLSLVLGAEISTLTLDGISVHMLGLLFDGEDKSMQNMLAESRDTRIPRMRKMIDLLAADGINISIEDVMAATPVGATLGRPHLADALVRNRVVATRDEAFLELLHNDSKYYVTHAAPTPEDAIRQINQAGGVAVIAHPFASRRGEVISAATFTNLVPAGLHGIEVNHRDHSQAEREQLAQIADQLGLVKTGSSDYHGNGKLNELGENLTDPEQWARLESLASARRVVTK